MAVDPPGAQAEPGATPDAAWKFVSFPDFFNFDVPDPWPGWDRAVQWFLTRVKAEDPDFVLVAGDLVNGHWWDGPKCIEHMSAVYYGGWVRRMQAYGLKFYVAVGDHELGDDPWPAEKIALVPHFGRAFAQHLGMPGNGPASKKGRAYYVLHKGTLIVTVETFEVVDGRMRLGVLGEQLDWLADVFKRHAAARHKICAGSLAGDPAAEE
ncbi:MAG: metallophosphoesterase [Verrucomicrobiae bacterium]|nr:metallophosphoesterase [Verrucomicrobiae bacterium]